MPVSARASLLALVIAAAACAPPEAAPVDTTADVAAVRAVHDAEVAAIANADVSGGYLAADAVMMPPNEPAVSGIDAIRTWLGGFFAQFTASVDYTTSNFNVSGDWAVETYEGTLTLTPVGGGDTVAESLKGIHVYRRGPDGIWKMVYDVWNSNTAPPAPEMEM